jgi:hypothetical protein
MCHKSPIFLGSEKSNLFKFFYAKFFLLRVEQLSRHSYITMFSALYIPTWQETILQELNIDVTKSWADRVEEEAMNKPIVINLDDSAGWNTAGHTKRNRSRLSDTGSDKSSSSNGSNVSPLGKIVHHQSWKGAKGDWGLIHPNAPIPGNKKEFVLFRGATPPPRGSIVAFEYTISDAGVLAQITNIVR